MSAPVNVITTKAGTVRPICEFCGRMGRAVAPDAVSERGHIDIFALGRGWSVAPYPPDFVHHDGSTGDLFECPECRRRLKRGESLRTRAYLEPEPVADPSDVEHVEEQAKEAAHAHAEALAAEQGRRLTADEAHELAAAVHASKERARAAYCRDVTHCADWPLCGHQDDSTQT